MDDTISGGDDEDGFSRAKLTQTQLLNLVERDVRSHSRSLTEIVKRINGGFTEQQMGQLHTVVREELADMGLRLDDPDHIEEAREDFRFLRRLRQNWDNSSKKAGNAVLLAIFAIVASLVGAGFWAWIRRGQGG